MFPRTKFFQIFGFYAIQHIFIHTCTQACTRTGTSSTTYFSDLICCPDEPHAYIFLQMLAPSYRAQVLF